jgi:multiple sugar transport system ATP-binding protein
LLKGNVAIEEGRPFLHLSGSRIELPCEVLPELGKYVGTEIIVGVRPEDLYEGEVPSSAARLARLPARVVAVEPLGAETLLVLTLGDSKEEVVARVGRQTGLRSGATATIALDTTALHLFDPATNKAIPCFDRGGTRL